MTGTRNFGDHTQWDAWNKSSGIEGWSQPGWAMPSDPSRYISKNDPYWDRVLESARHTYGDTSIGYDTDHTGRGRRLVFGDGTALPADGMVVYHDAASKQNWAQNDDGTVSLVADDGSLGAPVAPAGYRKIGDHYAPVNSAGQQIAPQLPGVPSSDNGFYCDPKTGVLTPKNTNGDYYALGRDGKKSFFDKNGTPITEQQFTNGEHQSAGAEETDPRLATDEQQSGKAADAVKKLQDELKQRFTTISDAEEKLSEVLLNAHATSTDGQVKLDHIQKKIVAAVNNPAMNTNTAAGEKAYLTFLRSQVSAIRDLLSSSSLSAEDQSKAAEALAALYAVDNGGSSSPSNDLGTANPPVPAATDPDISAESGLFDPGLGPPPAMPDPSLSDVLGGPMSPLGADPASSLASLLPGALGGLGGGLGAGAGPLDGLAGLAGAASPLADLAAGLGSQRDGDGLSDTADRTEKPDDDAESVKRDDTSEAPANAPKSNSLSGQPDSPAQSGDLGGPPTPVASPAAASPTVTLPDGSTADARTAQAVRDWLNGDTVDASYRQNGMTLPPVGTPVTHGVPPTRLHCGDVAIFKDHYEPVLSSVKGFLGGNVVPLSQVTSSPDFLGFIDPTATASVGGSGSGVAAPASPASDLGSMNPSVAAAGPVPVAAPVPAG